MDNFRLFAWLLFILLIAACASESSRYKDNSGLERPPEAAIGKQAPESEQDVGEAEILHRRHGKGLKSDVFRVEGSNRELQVRRTFDEAWSLLNQAIQQNNLKIKDQDRSKGAYYVGYDGGLLGLSLLFSKDSTDQPTYLLKVEAVGRETKVTASLANVHEQSDSGKSNDGSAGDFTEDKSEQLLELLYDTLHDKVKAE